MWNRNIAAKGSETVGPEPGGYHPHYDDDDSNDDDDADDDNDDDDNDESNDNDEDVNDDINDDNDDDDFVGPWSVSVTVVVGFLNVSSSPEFFIQTCCYQDQLVTIQYRHHCVKGLLINDHPFAFTNVVIIIITVVISYHLVQSGLIEGMISGNDQWLD